MTKIELIVTISADELGDYRYEEGVRYDFWPTQDSKGLKHLDSDWPDIRDVLRSFMRDFYYDDFEKDISVYLTSGRRGESLELELGTIVINENGSIENKNLKNIKNVQEFMNNME